MKKILILYHSGVGNTKKVSENISNILAKNFIVDLYSVEKLPRSLDLNIYDGLVIGFPVIHTHPTKTILKFIKKFKKLDNPKPTYIFTTCALYSANTLRIFAKHCITKNIIPVLDRVYLGCPATDGVLIAPFVKRFFRFHKDIDKNILKDLEIFVDIIKNGCFRLKIPKFKLYSILNYPNKLAGQMITFPIYVHYDKCVKCNKCINNCPSKAFKRDKYKYPLFNYKKCEKCYRCIHHCPKLALSLSKHNTPKKTLVHL